MPQKRKNFAFQCSDCAYPNSTSDDETKAAKNVSYFITFFIFFLYLEINFNFL